MTAVPGLPADLLHATAERRRQVALVVGAGCSLEAPTGLKLARTYAEDAHAQLLRDGVLADGDCIDPADLSALASAVFVKTGSQADLVLRLPVNGFRLARPNKGYLLAAALLREGVIETLLTLNFDLAMTAALTAVCATEIAVIPGPTAAARLASSTVVYLHRNVDEADPDRWILRTEALETEWQDGWEETVARRVLTCPALVFAGLGSPAAVLTKTVARIRESLGTDGHRAYVVDPSATTPFADALDLPPEAHIRVGWCAFMEELAGRVVEEFASELLAAARALCEAHAWHDESEYVPALSKRFHAVGLLAVGKMRSRWLLSPEDYVPDSSGVRGLIADLLLAVGLVERGLGDVDAEFDEDGAVDLVKDGTVRSRVLPVSGKGYLRWSALEPLVMDSLTRYPGRRAPECVLVGGLVGGVGAEVGPPEDLVTGTRADDLVTGFTTPLIVPLDDLRSGGIERLAEVIGR